MTVVDDLIGWLRERELEVTRKSGTGTEHVIVELPGEKKLKTSVLLSVSDSGLRIEAFVCRHPDENKQGVYQFLLQRNRRLYGVAYTIDRIGDIYLTARLAADAISESEIDRILGQILEAADGDFNYLLELGFAESIRREWAWRTDRGESRANLEAFKHLIEDAETENPS